ncbi:uncharacterized protein LOC128954007 [Oppia nitens]|uniref:uncharacterized protein LOC128954007 n=1 Tax=Oppia nitens TaxID=1686743 RepID=UPI0023DB4DC7|nr:uncharacterized protein LOC128954007 [Oppia nitens]
MTLNCISLFLLMSVYVMYVMSGISHNKHIKYCTLNHTKGADYTTITGAFIIDKILYYCNKTYCYSTNIVPKNQYMKTIVDNNNNGGQYENPGDFTNRLFTMSDGFTVHSAVYFGNNCETEESSATMGTVCVDKAMGKFLLIGNHSAQGFSYIAYERNMYDNYPVDNPENMPWKLAPRGQLTGKFWPKVKPNLFTSFAANTKPITVYVCTTTTTSSDKKKSKIYYKIVDKSGDFHTNYTKLMAPKSYTGLVYWKNKLYGMAKDKWYLLVQKNNSFVENATYTMKEFFNCYDNSTLLLNITKNSKIIDNNNYTTNTTTGTNQTTITIFDENPTYFTSQVISDSDESDYTLSSSTSTPITGTDSTNNVNNPLFWLLLLILVIIIIIIVILGILFGILVVESGKKSVGVSRIDSSLKPASRVVSESKVRSRISSKPKSSSPSSSMSPLSPKKVSKPKDTPIVGKKSTLPEKSISIRSTN